ncbi:hypothetical protein BB560_005482, partial [Smittium megazygosporum]
MPNKDSEGSLKDTESASKHQGLPMFTSENNETPPDQGYAWAVGLGGIVVMTVIFGCSNGFGVFQEYYLDVMFSSESAFKISWISTITFVVSFGFGPFVGPLVRLIGLRPTSLLSCVLCTGGLIGASFAKSIGMLVLTQAFIFGIGAAIGINTSLVMISLWFQKYRPLILATAMSFGGLGAIVVIVVVRKSIEAWGLDWSFRLLAIIAFVGLFYGFLVFKPRTTYEPSKKIIDFRLLKYPLTLTIVFNAFFNVIGWLVVSIYFSSVLVQIGKSHTTANNALLILSAATGVGRFVASFFAKAVGINNTLLLTNSICAIATFALWLPFKNYAIYLVFVVIFGFFYGFFFSLAPMLIASNYSPTQISQLNGLVYLFNGMGCLIWVPSLGKMLDSIGHRTDYTSLIISCGVSYIIIIVILLIQRFYVARRYPEPLTSSRKKEILKRCPFCNKNTPETIEHMLIECFRWNSIRHETTIFNIPRLYRTVTIDQSTDNQALNQGRNIMVGKLLGGESKETRSLLAQSRDRYSPYMKELETGRFMNGIRVVRTLILDRI